VLLLWLNLALPAITNFSILYARNSARNLPSTSSSSAPPACSPAALAVCPIASVAPAPSPRASLAVDRAGADQLRSIC
jgi:hypothetical protein